MTVFCKIYDIWVYKQSGGNMKLKPLFDRVVILPEIVDKVSECGIVLPETSQDRPQVGKVVAVGDGENIDNDKSGMKVCVGDRVLFTKYAGVEINLDEKKYIVMRQVDIIGVINE